MQMIPKFCLYIGEIKENKQTVKRFKIKYDINPLNFVSSSNPIIREHQDKRESKFAKLGITKSNVVEEVSQNIQSLLEKKLAEKEMKKEEKVTVEDMN